MLETQGGYQCGFSSQFASVAIFCIKCFSFVNLLYKLLNIIKGQLVHGRMKVEWIFYISLSTHADSPSCIDIPSQCLEVRDWGVEFHSHHQGCADGGHAAREMIT